MTASQFTIFGHKYPMGSYLLLIRISSPFQLAFGRFQQGRLFTISKGNYLYIGSALGRTGNPLAKRLIRHASRSNGKQPHEIRAAIIKLFSSDDGIGNCATEPTDKKLHWHIDYLLDHAEAEIEHIVIIRSPAAMEHQLSELLASLNETSQLAPRLGAQDTRNSTHILRITDREKILGQLGQYIPAFIDP
ncbi:MAG: DUF123 domain-containing protein [Chlorobiaceae bacterium]|nr:DUF123 domain-containing protein [Chlorobiaceae bacterium]